MKLLIFITYVVFCFYCILMMLMINKDNEIYQNDFSLSSFGQHFINTYNKEEIKKRNDNNEIFPLCYESNNKNCLVNTMKIFDKNSTMIFNGGNGELRFYPHADKMPQNCGFGKMVYDGDNQENPWECFCYDNNYFGGNQCDEPQSQLTVVNRCAKIAKASELTNTDVSTFNPFLEGVCVECVSSENDNLVPVLDSVEPQCQEINKLDEETRVLSNKDHCYYDALNPHYYNSPYNKYIVGYGCSCDYYSGFVEAQIEGFDTSEEISHACIKIGKRDFDDYHTTHIAYYTLQNMKKPIQSHEYTEFESPFDKIFKDISALFINQPAKDVVNQSDWLNRNLKPSKNERIRRINYPKDEWPIVDKIRLVNHYHKRKETNPISVRKLVEGRGFETKHWYELTNERWLSNAVWGHPIVYVFGDRKKCKWFGKVTLNPVGVKEREYYGITVKTKPGEIIRMDTRGYRSEEKKSGSNIVTLPPDHVKEMLNNYKTVYIAILYNTYEFRK